MLFYSTFLRLFSPLLQCIQLFLSRYNKDDSCDQDEDIHDCGTMRMVAIMMKKVYLYAFPQSSVLSVQNSWRAGRPSAQRASCCFSQLECHFEELQLSSCRGRTQKLPPF
ncbi:Hypothetical predicted protein [Xyrichtys novacula]|uniref:Secreted protein n=1 Tax=Xyrichtys novacula TaxID=13765 RepID=A0AAV1G602_XYRNO|nr:Hypothetical predicted protein [Xyrichtys novacula]